jgi:hypothetical protein
MAITKEEYVGTKIINEIESSNLVKTEYDTITKKMIAEFKNGIRYEYDDVPHQKYTHLDLQNLKEISLTKTFLKITLIENSNF